MTNEEIRTSLEQNNITYGTINEIQLKQLHKLLSRNLRHSTCFAGTYRMERLNLKDSRFFKCSSYYFSGREAVSFNKDGFIGMAGWASTENLLPIREAITSWITYIKSTKTTDSLNAITNKL